MRTLSPWDAEKYFKVPTEKTVLLNQSAVNQVCDSNPMRVGLILSGPAANASAFSVSISPITTIQAGTAIVSSNPYIMLAHSEWGALVQHEWFATSGVPSVWCTVIELILSDWPQNDPDDTEDVASQVAYLAQQIKALASKFNGDTNRAIYGAAQGQG